MNGIPFSSCLKVVWKKFAFVRTTWVIRSIKNCHPFEQLYHLFGRNVQPTFKWLINIIFAHLFVKNAFNRLNDLLTRLSKTSNCSKDLNPFGKNTSNRSKDLLAGFLKTSNRWNDLLSRSLEQSSIRSNDLSKPVNRWMALIIHSGKLKKLLISRHASGCL